MIPLAIPTLLKDLPWILCGLLAVALAICFAAYKTEEAGRANDKLAQEKAITKAQEKADALGNELVIQQAIAMGVTTKKETVYVDKIRMAPNDLERLRLGIVGMRDLVYGGSTPSPSEPAPAVPGPNSASGPK